MLSMHAISEAAISALPDRMMGRVTVDAEILGIFDVADPSLARDILVDPSEAPVFALDLYAGPL